MYQLVFCLRKKNLLNLMKYIHFIMFISIVVEHCNPIIFDYMDDDDVMRNIWV